MPRVTGAGPIYGQAGHVPMDTAPPRALGKSATALSAGALLASADYSSG